jgi:hypothetical protein
VVYSQNASFVSLRPVLELIFGATVNMPQYSLARTVYPLRDPEEVYKISENSSARHANTE